MNCPQCGTETDYRYCPQCGTDLKPGEETEIKPKKKDGIEINSPYAMFWGVVFCILLFLYFFTGNKMYVTYTLGFIVVSAIVWGIFNRNKVIRTYKRIIRFIGKGE